MEEIKLDSGLSEYAFGKTNFSTLITETGFIAQTAHSLTPHRLLSTNGNLTK